MQWWRSVLGGLVVAVLAGLVLSVGAWAAPGTTVLLGPVIVPEGPVRVCVADRCETTPPVSSVSMALTATAQPETAGGRPTVTGVSCPVGSGVAVRVTGSPAGTVVSGTLTLGVAGGTSIALPVRRTLGAGTQPLLVTACRVG